MLSVEGPTKTLEARLQHVGLVPGGALLWGDESACALILERRPPLILLDAPANDADALTRLVRAASLIAPVAILRPGRSDAVAALDAGALDVLDSHAPIAELAWRIHADLRRCPPTIPVPECPRGTASQRLLFDVLVKARTAICCHHLRLLLGTPDLPMTLRALRARIQRLLSSFSEHGRELVIDQQWGLATYCSRKYIADPTR
jgi:DNA-binding response OmpR family regulator